MYLTVCSPMDCRTPGFSVLGNSPGKNTGVGSHSLLQGIFVPGLEPGSPASQADSLPSEPPGKPTFTVALKSCVNFCCIAKWFRSDQIRSVAQSCLTLCDPMNCSTPGLPVHHQLPEFTQIHVHRVSDAIQPSHPLSSPSPPAPNPSQHQSLFQ